MSTADKLKKLQEDFEKMMKRLGQQEKEFKDEKAKWELREASNNKRLEELQRELEQERKAKTSVASGTGSKGSAYKDKDQAEALKTAWNRVPILRWDKPNWQGFNDKLDMVLLIEGKINAYLAAIKREEEGNIQDKKAAAGMAGGGNGASTTAGQREQETAAAMAEVPETTATTFFVQLTSKLHKELHSLFMVGNKKDDLVVERLGRLWRALIHS